MKKNILIAISTLFMMFTMVACDGSSGGGGASGDDLSDSGELTGDLGTDIIIDQYVGNTTPIISVGQPTGRVRAYDDFLRRDGQDVPVAPNKNSFDLKKAHKAFRKKFTYMHDIDKYGVDEYWTIMPDDDLVGDCEDFALTFREKLIEAGFTPPNVRIATCVMPNGYRDNSHQTYHAVLIVEVFWGEVYVVDSKRCLKFDSFKVIEWDKVLDETGNYWVKMRIPKDKGNGDPGNDNKIEEEETEKEDMEDDERKDGPIGYYDRHYA